MRRTLFILLLKLLSWTSRFSFYGPIDMASSFDDIREEGLSVRGYGFIFRSRKSVSGLYLVDYVPEIMENKYGRYN